MLTKFTNFTVTKLLRNSLPQQTIPRLWRCRLEELPDTMRMIFIAASKRMFTYAPIFWEKICPRRFAPLERASEHKGSALVITELITTRILEDHFFVGDLTSNNVGAILETGIALALKPNRRLVLVTQDSHEALHFDLKVTHVTRYTSDTLVETVAQALVEAARSFEDETRLYITQVSASLTSDAISVLNIYGRLWKGWQPGSPKPSIFQRVAGSYNKEVFASEIGRVLFEQAARELVAHRLLWTNYRSNVAPGSDSFGHHATEL